MVTKKNKVSLMKRIITATTASVLGVCMCLTGVDAATTALPDLSEGKTGSLTIHKYSSSSEGGTPTGTEEDAKSLPADAEPLEGIEFTLFKYGGTEEIGKEIPVYDEENLDGSKGSWTYTVSEVPVEGVSKDTDETGEIKFESLALGRYLVVETYAPEAVTKKTEPFFVDIPMSDPKDRDKWIYDVSVYPKNVVDWDDPEIDKDITAPGNKHETATVGDELTWIINSKNPTTIRDYTKYTISDTLDDKLSLVTDSVKVTWGKDFESAEAVADSNYDFVPSGQTFTVSFKPEYLSTVTKSDADNVYYFYVLYKTKLTEAKYDADGNAEAIENDASVTYDYKNKPKDDTGFTDIPDDDKPEVHTGGLKFTKVNSKGNKLTGAEFKIATTEDNARNGIFVQNPEGGDMTAVSGDDGIISFDGLAYGTTGQSAKEGSSTYWVVETKAPEGYQLLTAPKSFTVDWQLHSTVHAEDTTLVNNALSELPKTGSESAIICISLGTMLLAAGVIFAAKKKSV